MSGIYPKFNDTDQNLWFAIAWNYYSLASAEGYSGLTPPNLGDRTPILMKKVAYYTAILAEPA